MGSDRLIRRKERKEKERKPTAARSKKEAKPSEGMAWICLLKGMAAAFGITCIIFIGFGILLTYTSVSEDSLPLVALICTAISAAVAGYDWAACRRQKGLLWGLLAGLVYMLLLLVITGLASDELQLQSSALMMLAVALAGGGIGGVLGVNRKG